ncbi:MAG: hypothetical protein J6C45_03840 [Alistipes sp.]|nr:hypothetical protein [Alistipes sp.]
MRIAHIAIMLLGTALLSGCATKRVTTIQQDSVRVEVRERVELVTDTITVAIPDISEAVTTRDTTSRLENDYAFSYAAVAGGLLHHSLATKPQLRRLAYQRPVYSRDSIIYRNYYRDITTEVQRELSWLQRAQINGFWALLIIFSIFLIIRWAFGRE